MFAGQFGKSDQCCEDGLAFEGMFYGFCGDIVSGSRIQCPPSWEQRRDQLRPRSGCTSRAIVNDQAAHLPIGQFVK